MRERAVPGPGGIGETLQQVAARLARAGDRDAILFYHRDSEVRWSFAELGARVDRLAAWLVAQGAGAGAPVAVIGGNSPAWVAACLAVLRAGAAVMPLDAQLGGDAFAHVLADSGTRLVLASAPVAARHAERCRRTGATLVTLEEIDGLEADLPAAWPQAAPDDRAALFYTSGTTGVPKGVPLTHRNLTYQIGSLAAADLVRADERILQPLPLHHVYPLVVGTLTPLALGCALILTGGFTGGQVLGALRRGRATLIIGVPRLYEALLAGIHERLGRQRGLSGRLVRSLAATAAFLHDRFGWRTGRALLKPLHRRLAPALRTLVSGGAALKPETGRRLEALGWRVATGYGLTETSPMVSFIRPGDGDFETAGPPIPGTEVVSDGSAEKPAEIRVRGPGVFAGYLNLPEKTCEVLTPDGWFRTGDLGWVGADGRLRIAGRSATLIVTAAGKNLQPDEIEDAYLRHPLIAEIAVFQRDGRLAGLIVPELRALGDEPVEAAVRRAVAEAGRALRPYERLEEFAVSRDPIPRTRLGKPRRHLIAAAYERARGGKVTVGAEDRRPITPEAMSDEDRALLDDPAVAAAWALLAEKYHDRRLTPDSDLRLDIGIDSIEWLDLGLELSERTGVSLSDAAIAEVSTVRDLLLAVAEAEPETTVASPLADPDSALSEAQRAWLRPRGALERAMGRVFHTINRALMRLLFLRRVEGRQHLAGDRPVILAPNHLSYLDPFVLAAAIDHRRLAHAYWAGWTGVVFTTAVRRWFARVSRVLPIDHDRPAASSLAFGAAALKGGHALIWFPEGERSRSGRLGHFKAGLGMLVERYPVPVVPVAITGTHEAWPPGSTLPRPHPVTIRFLPPRTAAELEALGHGPTAAARIVDGIKRDIAAALGEAIAEPAADAAAPEAQRRHA